MRIPDSFPIRNAPVNGSTTEVYFLDVVRKTDGVREIHGTY
jgi:hypothetical protein